MAKFSESTGLIFRSLRRFLSLSLILAAMILGVRIYEILFVYGYSGYPAGSFGSLLRGFQYDIIFYLRASAVLMLPYLTIAFFSQKTARYFFIVVSILLILGDFLLLNYFTVGQVPLGADLFGYSIAEISHTIGASGDVNYVFYIFIVAYLSLMVWIFAKHVYFRLKPWLMIILTAAMVGSLLPVKQLNPRPEVFDDEFSMFLATNKPDYFFRSNINRSLQMGLSVGSPENFKHSAKTNDSIVYTNPDYPFLHNETTPDILGEYFDLKPTPPNLVFIVVESLGRDYCGPGATLGSYTPFLDSLIGKSLFWENCLATSGRTFEVMPTLFASVPFGNNGFAELGEKMPRHEGIIGILKKQAGYQSMFVYGGEAEFDKMDFFLERQGIDTIIDSKSFHPKYQKLPATGNGFSWGYGDKEIFSQYISSIGAEPDKPRLDVILTLAIHDPFLVPDQEYYNQRFDERFSSLELDEKIRNFSGQYKKQLASVLYTDDALRLFFEEIAKLPGFQNSIFIITGDHRMPEIPLSTQIDRFRVPLIVYSPLLKYGKKFSSVVSHFDITPSLIAMLAGGKYIVRPQQTAWIGRGLDNSVAFRNLNSYPLMRNKNELLDYIDGDYFLADRTLYKIYPNLYIEPIDSLPLQKKLKEGLDNFILKNNYACQNNKLLPE